jgi:hypothetical protein
VYNDSGYHTPPKAYGVIVYDMDQPLPPTPLTLNLHENDTTHIGYKERYPSLFWQRTGHGSGVTHEQAVTINAARKPLPTQGIEATLAAPYPERWKPFVGLRERTTSSTMTVVDHSLYIIGGNHEIKHELLAPITIVSLVDGHHKHGAPLPTPREHPESSVLVNEQGQKGVLVTGGLAKGMNESDAVEWYDCGKDTWHSLPPMLQGKQL